MNDDATTEIRPLTGDRWLRGFHGPLLVTERRPRYRVAGVRLRPLCLWHVRMFELLGCGPMDDWHDLKHGDVCQILAVCRARPCGRVRPLGWRAQRWVDRHLEAVKVSLGVYLGEWLEAPVAMEPAGRGKPAKTPWWLYYWAAMRHYFGMSEREAWGAPVGAAVLAVTACREVMRLAPPPAGSAPAWLSRGEWESAPDEIRARLG